MGSMVRYAGVIRLLLLIDSYGDNDRGEPAVSYK